MLVCALLEDDCPILRLRLETLLSLKPPHVVLLATFLTARRTRPRPRPASASSSVLLGESALTGDALRLDLVWIDRNRRLVVAEKEEGTGGTQPASYLHG